MRIVHVIKCLFAVVCGLLARTAWAHLPVSVEPQAGDGMISADWSVAQLGVFPVKYGQLFEGRADVYGVAVSLLSLRQRSAVFSVALENRVKTNYGLQVGLIGTCEDNYAIQVAPFGSVRRNSGIAVGLVNGESNWGFRSSQQAESGPGVQIGLLNMGGGLQIGLLNYNPQGLLPWFPVINFPAK